MSARCERCDGLSTALLDALAALETAAAALETAAADLDTAATRLDGDDRDEADKAADEAAEAAAEAASGASSTVRRLARREKATAAGLDEQQRDLLLRARWAELAGETLGALPGEQFTVDALVDLGLAAGQWVGLGMVGMKLTRAGRALAVELDEPTSESEVAP